jgi:hypothetical protein
MFVERCWTSRLGTRSGEPLPAHRQSLYTLIAVMLCFRAIGVQTQVTRGKPVDLPGPSASANNPASVVPPPVGFAPHVPQRFEVSILASDFEDPRWLAVTDVLVYRAKRWQVLSREIATLPVD